MVIDITFNQKVEVIKTVREIAAQTCMQTFQHVLKYKNKISEYKFINFWNILMYKSHKIIGFWYQPPPNGTSALFFDNKHISRANYDNLRGKEYWPNKQIFLRLNGGGYVFSSPYYLLNDIPLIGDFGFSFYLGNDSMIKEHYRRCMKLLGSIIQIIEPGMKFSKLYKTCIDLMQNNGYANLISSSTDQSGTNIGHTIPFLDSDLHPADLQDINSKNSGKINNLISNKRIFFNENSDYVISNNCSFTFEPRFTSLTNKKLPMFSLHQIVLFVDSRKEILANFTGIIKLLDMQWIYS